MMKQALGLAVLTVALWPTGHAHGQERRDSVTLLAGSGMSLATGQRSTLTGRTPIFADASYRTWNTEDPRWVWGGSVRMELEGRASLGVVPRGEISTVVGPLTVRPGVGVPLFVAPFTLIGIEGSVTVRLAVGEGFGIVASLFLDAFFRGSDLPDDSVLLMANGALGIDMVF